MTDHSSNGRRVPSTTRRRLVRGGAAAVGAAAAPAVAGAATAQTETTGNPGATDTDDGDREKTLTAALPSSAPTYGKDDYTGLFVQIGERKGDVDPSGIDSCSFVASEGTEQVWGYTAEMFERRNEDQGGETTTLYALAENTSIGSEKRYIINNSQPCGDYVQVQLERLPSGPGGGEQAEADPGANVGTDTTGTTETSTPGFGVLAALGGIGAATAGALAARGDDADE